MYKVYTVLVTTLGPRWAGSFVVIMYNQGVLHVECAGLPLVAVLIAAARARACTHPP